MLSEHYNDLMQMETIPIESDHKEGTFMNPIGIRRRDNRDQGQRSNLATPTKEANKSINLKSNLLHKRKNNPLEEQAASLRKKHKTTIVKIREGEHDCIQS